MVALDSDLSIGSGLNQGFHTTELHETWPPTANVPPVCEAGCAPHNTTHKPPTTSNSNTRTRRLGGLRGVGVLHALQTASHWNEGCVYVECPCRQNLRRDSHVLVVWLMWPPGATLVV